MQASVVASSSARAFSSLMPRLVEWNAKERVMAGGRGYSAAACKVSS